jgi:hypothetical protein
MKPDKEPKIKTAIEVVNMIEFAPTTAKKHNGNKPLTLNKTELAERQSMGLGQVKFYRPEQVPEYNETTHRKRSCPICGYNRGGLIAICPKCKNCMACGSYNGDNRDRICKTCGNYDSGKPQNVPTIIVN